MFLLAAAFTAVVPSAVAQSVFPAARAATNAALPDPVHWSQQVFLIPYKWDSGTTATGASAVKLYLSQDRGQTWNEISDAKPEVQFFNYHAPGDGEYWFSMRTVDATGRAWPDGPHQAELRVIVDTQNPTVTTFNAQLRADGTAIALWQASDANIDTTTAKLQYRTPEGDTSRDVPSCAVRTPSVGFAQGDATWQVPAGTPSLWVRLTVRDRAGNGREAGAEARMGATPGAQLASSANLMQLPRAGDAGVTSSLPYAADNFNSTSPSVGWTAAPNNSAGPLLTNGAPSLSMAPATPLAAPQTWPSDGASPVPLGAPRTMASNQVAAPPLGAFAPQNQRGDVGPRTTSPESSEGLLGRELAATSPNVGQSQPFTSPFRLPSSASNLPNTRTASARPFGNSAPPAAAATANQPAWNNLPALPAGTAPQTFGGLGSQPGRSLPRPSQQAMQHLNSLDFEIGYEVDTAGTFGVTRVELWGTSNGGQSWQRLAVDTDNRSPITAAVPAPGDYGLKIVVETAGGIDPVRPRPGDRPEMRVRIDTTPPVAKLTGISQGAGANADNLMVQWQGTGSFSTDETVSLAYSSHPSGPWVTGVSNLANNGRYAWRLARHMPRSFYVRLEIRDLAGNLSTDQTQVPVEVTLPTPSGRLGSVRAVQ